MGLKIPVQKELNAMSARQLVDKTTGQRKDT